MLDLDHSEDTFLFLALEFDIEVPCFQIEKHPDDELHSGDTKATHYWRIACPHANCDNATVVPVCDHLSKWIKLMLLDGYNKIFRCERCKGLYEFHQANSLTPIDNNG